MAPELEEMKPEGFLVVQVGPDKEPDSTLAACTAEKVNLPSGTAAPVVFLLPEAAARGVKQLLVLKDIFYKNGGGWSWFGTIEKFSLDLHNTIFRIINNHPYSDIKLS